MTSAAEKVEKNTESVSSLHHKGCSSNILSHVSYIRTSRSKGLMLLISNELIDS